MSSTARYAAALMFWTLFLHCSEARGQNVTIKIDYKGRSYYGKPLAWDGKDMLLLRRDGRSSILPVSAHSDYTKVADHFKPQRKDTIRTRLQKEFAGKYQVSITRNFVVVHPHGDFQQWAMPFETLYARFQAYFQSRGFELNRPEFPMIAVVLKTRSEFDRFLRSYHDYDRDILGYYSTRSNRIITYDQSEGRRNDQSWFFTADTIIHEATHQTAFNTGVHNRFGSVPRWISEGLAMMFEAPGVNNSMYFSRQADRINRSRLIALKHYYQRGEVDEKLYSLVASDRLFDQDASLAYAMAWGLSFYLAEAKPREYFQLLQRDGARKEYGAYPPQSRLREFAQVISPDIEGLEMRMKQFYKELEIPPRR